MKRLALALGIVMVVAAYVTIIVRADRKREAVVPAAGSLDSVPAPRARAAVVVLPDESQVLHEAAARAWRFVDRNYHERTGLVSPLDEYPVTTMWDMGSALAAHFSAREIGLISDSLYRARMQRMLDGLASLPLFAGIAFNKRYFSTSVGMAAQNDQPSPGGYGWSAIDIGRLLLWLDIIRSHDSTFAAAAMRAARRLDLQRMTRAGELLGGMRRGSSVVRYQEGRIGYEQYAARGFDRWGAQVDSALDLLRYAQVVRMGGDRLIGDRRRSDCLTSDPLLMIGLEVGWNADEGRLAQSLLQVQQTRYERSGVLTAVNEDALFAPPHHFYYYCALANDTAFVVLSPANLRAPFAPRTISTKAAFGWYGLLPNSYSAMLLREVVAAAKDAGGWPSAFDEQTRAPAGGENINTAAIVLEAAAYVARGRRPLDRIGS